MLGRTGHESGQPLAGRWALVTGGVRGIGWGCAMALARAGAQLVINDCEESTESHEALTRIRELGVKAEFVPGDAFAEESGSGIVAAALEFGGRIDIFISNPALSKRGPFLETSRETFEAIVRGTLMGGFSMSRHVARHMVERGGGGKIVFISSVHAQRPYANCVSYNAAKAGLDHMARSIAVELLPHRINVNVIQPGWIETPGEHRTFGAETIASEGPKLPWGRIGTPEDIGQAAAFLASNAADYMTGATLVVDGGYSLKDALP